MLIRFLYWYFLVAAREILRAGGNFLRFNLHFFSIPLLFKTFFAPWRRYSWDYGRGFSVTGHLEVFFSNLISRTLGAIMRLVLISVGLTIELVIFLTGLFVLMVWFALPFLIGLGFWLGIEILSL